MKRPLYQALSSALQARENCVRSGNTEWLQRHTERMLSLNKNHMPSGSGVDAGTQLLVDESTPEKLVFTLGFHHMNESGMYDGWTEHRVTVRPSLQHQIKISISGRDRNEIKAYLYKLLSHDLLALVDEYEGES